MTAENDSEPSVANDADRQGGGSKNVGGAMTHVAARPLLMLVIAIVAVSLFFVIFPSVDIAVSAAFFSDDDGFSARHDAFLKRLRELGPFLVTSTAITAAIALLIRLLLPALRKRVDARAPVFLLSSLVLGPGLLVNTILKDNWGRARPKQVDLFGGEAPYTSVWQITDNCERNCSFVSGEASSAIWLMALAFIAPANWRKTLIIGIAGLTAAVSLNRVAFGGHFLSDTLLSWLLTLSVLFVLHRWIYDTSPAFLKKDRLEETIDRFGDRLIAGFGALWSGASRRLRGFARHLR